MTEVLKYKDKFVERYSNLTDFEAFRIINSKYLRRSIRVNTLKISVDELKKRLEKEWKLDPVPWCKEGFWIDHKGEGEDYRRDIGNLPEHSLGYIFIQEAASMIPPIVLDPQPGEKLLDMCASPGAKTTQIAQYMQNKGALIANDYKVDRMKPLSLNIQRMGITCAMTTKMEGRFFRDLEFDRVLCDAPCSGTGTIRKSLKTLRIWNPTMIRRLAGTQKQLIKTAFSLLKPGGTMVYSTCSLEPEEDEAVVSHLLDSFENARVVPFSLPGLGKSEPVLEFEGNMYRPEVKDTLRIWPQENDTEGFFVAKIMKD